MATLDLSLVTLTLRNLLHANVRRLLGGIPAAQLEVTMMPPELVDAAIQTLNLHLYSVDEDPHFKNAVGLEGGNPAISGQPMALRLYYVLTAHLTVADEFDAESQQKIMGMAMKTLHDNPVITETLQISPVAVGPSVTVMEALLRGGGNRIEVSLRPMAPEDTVAFWAAEDQRTPRLSAFYEARTVLIEPEVPTATVGTIFDVGIYVRSAAAAKVMASHAELRFTTPTATGLGSQSVEVIPARATLQPVAVANKPRIRVTGRNMTNGDSRQVTLRAFAWAAAEVLDPTLNLAWDLRIEPNEISFVPQPTLDVDDGAGGVNTLDIAPGGHEVGLRVINYRYQGSARLETVFDAGRAAVGFGVHIDGATTVPDGNGHLQINTSPASNLLTPGTEIALAIGGEILSPDAALAPMPAGQGFFQVFANRILFGPIFNPAIAAAYPVQLVLNGVEAQPFWVEV